MNEISAMNGKELGDYTELKFQLMAFKKGFVVSKPFGENSKYDFIVDFNSILSRVQVRGTNASANQQGGYKILTHHAKGKCFTKSEIDCLVGYIIPENVWYIFPIDVIKNSKTVTVHPTKDDEKYHEFKDRWDFSKALNRKMGYKRVGSIYQQKYGYVVRRGVISKYFKEIEDAENYLDELNIKPTRLSQKHDNII